MESVIELHEFVFSGRSFYAYAKVKKIFVVTRKLFNQIELPHRIFRGFRNIGFVEEFPPLLGEIFPRNLICEKRYCGETEGTILLPREFPSVLIGVNILAMLYVPVSSCFSAKQPTPS